MGAAVPILAAIGNGIAAAAPVAAQVGTAAAQVYGTVEGVKANKKANEIAQQGVDEQKAAQKRMETEQNKKGSEAIQLSPSQQSMSELEKQRLRNRGLSQTMYASNRFNLLGGNDGGLLGG